MGLIQAVTASAGSVFADQWKEFFCCDAMPVDVLVRKGVRKVGRKSSNTRGSDNIITNGSTIVVNEGQCMLIVDQGKITEVCAQPGEFVYDSSTEGSVFAGELSGFGTTVATLLDAIGRRFTYGGDTGKDQRIYYVNTREITDNKYGTSNAVPFRVVDTNIGLDMDISIRCFGVYSFRITNPVLFYGNVSGNVRGDYTRDKLESQMKSELLTALQPAFARVSAMGVRYSALPGHTIELSNALNDILSEKWKEQRGIEIVSFGVSSVKASEEDEAMIKELQRTAVFRNPGMAAASLVGAQGDAMKAAAANANGAMMGFMGMNYAQQAGGMNTADLFAMNQQAQAAQPAPAAAPAADTWTCSCGHTGTGKFCADCGAPRPAGDGWTCPSCGNVNKGRFCSECGTRKPAEALLYRCDKCGWEPEDPTKPPKFCPECGDPFNDEDIVK